LLVAPSTLQPTSYLLQISISTPDITFSPSSSSLPNHTASLNSFRALSTAKTPPSLQTASIDESASIMSSSDNKAQVFKGRVVPRVKTTKHQQMMAAMKKTLEDPVAMAKVRQDCRSLRFFIFHLLTLQ
jgi:hypothetical protein